MSQEIFDWFTEVDNVLALTGSLDSDSTRRIEESVREDIYEDAKFTGATSDECQVIYSEWLKKYRKPRPELHIE